jgi:hypothetical protein
VVVGELVISEKNTSSTIAMFAHPVSKKIESQNNNGDKLSSKEHATDLGTVYCCHPFPVSTSACEARLCQRKHPA